MTALASDWVSLFMAILSGGQCELVGWVGANRRVKQGSLHLQTGPAGASGVLQAGIGVFDEVIEFARELGTET
ncbi:hypothetical protein ABTH30_24810, partial [Acinetobacter baumannii]